MVLNAIDSSRQVLSHVPSLLSDFIAPCFQFDKGIYHDLRSLIGTLLAHGAAYRSPTTPLSPDPLIPIQKNAAAEIILVLIDARITPSLEDCTKVCQLASFQGDKKYLESMLSYLTANLSQSSKHLLDLLDQLGVLYELKSVLERLVLKAPQDVLIAILSPSNHVPGEIVDHLALNCTRHIKLKYSPGDFLAANTLTATTYKSVSEPCSRRPAMK